MLRRTKFFRARPYGPTGSLTEFRIDDNHERSEITMANHSRGVNEFSSMRRQFKNPVKYHRLRAIPRDLGTIPRDYVIRLLFFNQPCSVDTLWALAKADEKCPFDSKKHMKLLLKIAGLQKWIIYEKNQTTNEFLCQVHPDKGKEAQELLYEYRHRMELQERENQRKKIAREEENKKLSSEALEAAIQNMQQQLVNSVVKLQEHKPEIVKDLPCVVPESGAIDFLWYKNSDEKSVVYDRASSGGSEGNKAEEED